MGAQLVRALFVYASISTVSGFFGGPHRLTRSSHAQRSSLSMAEEPNLLQEQMKEFADGFGGLFGKPVPAPEPVKSTPPPPVVKKVEEVIPDVVKIASSIETDEVKKETPVVAPVAEPVVVVKEPVVVAQPEEVIDEQPMAKKAAPPAPKAETPPPAPKVEAPPAPKVEKKDPPVFSNPSPSMVKKDEMGAVAVKDVPIKAASTDKKPDPKEEIVKAQQAVTKSFLSFGSSLNEVNLKQVEALAAKAVANTVTTKTSEESAKPPAAPAGGYFNFLGGGKPEVKSEPTPAPKAPVVKAPAPAPVEAPKPSGGFFSFLESKDDKVATPASTPKTAAPVVKVVPPPAPVAKAPVAPPAPAPRGGGFFSFLESDPTLAPVVAKTAAAKAPAVPKVSEKVVEEVTSSNQRQFSTPTIAQARSEASKGTSDTSPRSAAASSKSQAPASPRGGMFDFLKPVDNEDISAPVVKAAPVAAPKAPSPAPKAPAAPAASGGGFFSFLQSSPGVGGTSAPPADVKPAMAMKSKAPTAAVATKEAPTVTGMNPRFLATISKLLKNDASKIKTFQKSTDAFRYGDLTPVAFLSQLEKLFGEGQLEAVVIPLVAELPERDIATQLKTTYQKQVAAESAKRAADEKKRLEEEKVAAMKKKAADDAARVKAAADAKAATAAAAAALKKKQEDEKRAKVVVPVAKVAAPVAAKASPFATVKPKVAAPAASTPAAKSNSFGGLFGGGAKKPEPVAPPAPAAKSASFGGGLFGGAKPKPPAAPAAPAKPTVTAPISKFSPATKAPPAAAKAPPATKAPPAKSATTTTKPPTFFASPKAAVQPPTKK